MPLLQSLELDKSFLILSAVTDQIYLDEDRNAYLFFQEMEAEAFLSTHLNTVLSGPSFRNKNDLLAYCYGHGVKHLIMTQNGKTESSPIAENRVIPGFYNGDLNAALTLLKETKQEKYLKDMIVNQFIVPIRIRTDKLSQEIVYGIVRHPDKVSFSFLAFTDLIEYHKWAKNVDGWKPLLVEFDIMCQIGKQHGYCINLMGNKLFMPYELMHKYRE